MKHQEIKIEEHLAKHEVATLLRAIADAVEHDDHAFLARVGGATHNAKKNKKEGVHLSLRLKIKSGSKDEAPAPENMAVAQEKSATHRPAFKDLKKRMKTDFALLAASLKGDTLPPLATVASFLAAAELMVSCRGYGDDYYDAFTRACLALRDAGADANRCREALQSITERMRECHQRFKK